MFCFLCIEIYKKNNLKLKKIYKKVKFLDFKYMIHAIFHTFLSGTSFVRTKI
jgi:hypothetical protein